MSNNKNNNNNNNNNHKGKKRMNKGKKQHGKKNFYSSGQGGKKNSKTLFIGKIYMEDIQRSEVSVQLIQHRISYLLSVFEKYGQVEHFQNNIESNNYMLVTYKTREIAEKVLKKLRDAGEMENLMDQIRVQLGKNKIPGSVCPSLNRYKYDWSDKPAVRPKTAYSMKKSYQKEQVETVKESKDGQQNGSSSVKSKKKKSKKKPQKKYRKKTEDSVVQENQQKSPVEEKKVEPEKVQVKEERKKIDAEDLRREADKAKLKDELDYLSKQLENVEAEINAENKRCKDRDVRINKLEEELRRVDTAKSRLERQLSNETRWKKLNQEAVSQLKRELDHIRQEQQSATLRLNQSEDQTQQSDVSLYL